ncbi:MAG: tryptophan 7-halogenase [Trueperaceae bacterium]|nr:tryptophan 7-halogenase [Trueperaceae bacterium]
MKYWPSSIVIVGGGTAGWLAAIVLASEAKRMNRHYDITVVESSDLGTVGVGEGTTSVFRHLLTHFKLDEFDFLRETGATIKLGIRHKDWRRLGHHYDGPLDVPEMLTGPGLDLYSVSAGKAVTDSHLFQHLINFNRAPFAYKENRLIPAGPFHHAYHFDQVKAGAWLRRQAKDIKLIDDQVKAVKTGPFGIEVVTLASGKELSADLFLDCTGFRRVLIKELGAEWLPYGDVLPVNRAMPFWLELEDGEEIPPVTLAWAQKNGWLWQIPTQQRYGCGYVYSDNHISPEEAKAEIETVLGRKIEPRNDIKINAGRLNHAWIENCVALGLSSAFLEPLEATSIHGTIVQLLMLSALLEKGSFAGRNQYNQAVARQVDDFRDFIRLHYVSERRDSTFWQDVAETHPKTVTDWLEFCETRVPQQADFPAFPLGLPHVGAELYLPILDGLGLLDKAAAKSMLADQPKLRAVARKTQEQLVQEYRAASTKCIPHRTFLSSLAQSR